MSIKKSKSESRQCQICTGPAVCSYFGAISCTSCKTFFRRNGLAEKGKFRCYSSGNCEINLNTRHLCTACRLEKCLACGMSTDLFRGPRTAISNRKTPTRLPTQMPTLNLLQSDLSSLTTDQWTLLTNLIQIYQESQLASIAERFTLLHLQNADRSSTELISGKLIQEWTMSICETTSRYLRLNIDLCQLPSDDRSLVIRTASANVSCMGGTIISRNYSLDEIDCFTNVPRMIYGSEIMDKHQRSLKFMDSDTVLLKLGLALFVFSELNYIYSPSLSFKTTNSFNVVNVQNRYAEVTWKYLLYRYGYHQAIRKLMNLTSWFMATALFIGEVQHMSMRIDDMKSLIDEEELKLVLDDVDRINDL